MESTGGWGHLVLKALELRWVVNNMPFDTIRNEHCEIFGRVYRLSGLASLALELEGKIIGVRTARHTALHCLHEQILSPRPVQGRCTVFSGDFPQFYSS